MCITYDYIVSALIIIIIIISANTHLNLDSVSGNAMLQVESSVQNARVHPCCSINVMVIHPLDFDICCVQVVKTFLPCCGARGEVSRAKNMIFPLYLQQNY